MAGAGCNLLVHLSKTVRFDMPTYEYTCRRCGKTIEVFQSFSDKPLKTHDECGGELKKVFHARGVVFKGSGFYATDSRSAPAKATTSSKSEKSEKTSSDPKSSSGDASKTSSSSESSTSSSGSSTKSS
jgi:putative FmdB family regulatory protein